ncbi:CopG family transcriptional regulator [Thioalkalicoccus limnaeus]|uniref:ribbon-helix-helix domain-containing protein n=1 Tax=Thioalkalicoccus limnaeus TaxID=120681 RepID=UPI0034E94F03
MTRAARQARWRARDSKHLVQVRLTPEAVERLDKLVQRAGVSGRAELIERLLMADAGPSPGWVQNESVRLARSWFRATGERFFTMGDESYTYEVGAYPRR